MSVQKISDGTRKLYRIMKGSYSRREGDAQQAVDPESGKPIRGYYERPYVHYSARSGRRPHARDEVWLSPAEYKMLGGGTPEGLTLREIAQGDVKTVTLDVADQLMTRDLPDDLTERVNMLIEEGQAIKKNAQLKMWRRRVFDAKVLQTTTMPTKRVDILEALISLEI